ncbi:MULTISPECIES: DUF2057 family protein [Ferrimonas]|uniref:DUF2057 family protein n=1 Tax=Ferrimonas TaxID=44011 RepID=UPI00042485DC|nr:MULTISPECIES: DUF2057 family protein [Ferrimonas]USD36227.1 DUF2057 family protein [Ferrimonas sp. SCSIO 43195]
MKALLLIAATTLSLSLSAETLHLGDNVRVIAINGKPVPAYVDTITLTKGPQQITVRYDVLFEPDADSHAFIRSELHQLQFVAKGSGDYYLNAPSPSTAKEGKMLANQPQFTLQDQSRQTVNHSLKSHTELFNQLQPAGNQF